MSFSIISYSKSIKCESMSFADIIALVTLDSLMALKYVMASRADMSSSHLPLLLPHLLVCLDDNEDEDVKNEAAACMLPVVRPIASQPAAVVKV